MRNAHRPSRLFAGFVACALSLATLYLAALSGLYRIRLNIPGVRP